MCCGTRKQHSYQHPYELREAIYALAQYCSCWRLGTCGKIRILTSSPSIIVVLYPFP